MVSWILIEVWRKFITIFSGNIVRSNGAWNVSETEMSIFSKVKSLQIGRADREHMGKYSCRAANSIGVAETQVQVYRE